MLMIYAFRQIDSFNQFSCLLISPHCPHTLLNPIQPLLGLQRGQIISECVTSLTYLSVQVIFRSDVGMSKRAYASLSFCSCCLWYSEDFFHVAPNASCPQDSKSPWVGNKKLTHPFCALSTGEWDRKNKHPPVLD